jgi:hypothetical protein
MQDNVIEQTVFESIISFYVKSHFPDFTNIISKTKNCKIAFTSLIAKKKGISLYLQLAVKINLNE